MTDSDKAWALVNFCLKQGRYGESAHPIHLNNARTDYAAIVGLLATLPVNAAQTTDPAAWGFDKLRREAPQRLEAMQRDEPVKFEMLKDLYLAEMRVKNKKTLTRTPKS